MTPFVFHGTQSVSPSAIVDKRRTDGRLPCQLQHLLCPVDGVCVLLDSLFTDRHCPTAPSGIIARITAAHKKHQSIRNRNAVTLIPPPSAAPHRHTPPLPLGAIQHWAIYGRMNGCRNCHRSIHLSRAEWPYLQVQPESDEVLQVEE